MTYFPKGWHSYHAAIVFGVLAGDGFVVSLAHAVVGGGPLGGFGVIWALLAFLCGRLRLNAYGSIRIAEGVLSHRFNRVATAAIDWNRVDLNGPTIVFPRKNRQGESLVIHADRYGPELRNDLKVLADGFRRLAQKAPAAAEPALEPSL